MQVLILDSTEARFEGARMSARKLAMADARADSSPKSGIAPEPRGRLRGASLRMGSEADACDEDTAFGVLDLLRELEGKPACVDKGVPTGTLLASLCWPNRARASPTPYAGPMVPGACNAMQLPS